MEAAAAADDGNDDDDGSPARCARPLPFAFQWRQGLLHLTYGTHAQAMFAWEARGEAGGSHPGRYEVTPADAARILKASIGAAIGAYEETVLELRKRFPDMARLTALSVLEPEWWFRNLAAASREPSKNLADWTLRNKVSTCATTITTHYGRPRRVQVLEGGRWVEDKTAAGVAPPLLNGDRFSAQQDAFVAHIKAHIHEYKYDPKNKKLKKLSPTAELWADLSAGGKYGAAGAFFPEWIKAASILLCTPITSVDCERRFSKANLVKTAIRNALKAEHLNTCVRIASCGHDVADYDFKLALEAWVGEKDRRRRGAPAPMHFQYSPRRLQTEVVELDAGESDADE